MSYYKQQRKCFAAINEKISMLSDGRSVPLNSLIRSCLLHFEVSEKGIRKFLDSYIDDGLIKITDGMLHAANDNRNDSEDEDGDQ